MTGKVIIVTGANSGLGYEAARSLCAGGNEVILACRSEEKGNASVDKILKENPNALATFMSLDLADLESVRKFVNDFKDSGKKLHVLINNAGVYLNNKNTVRQFTKDNFELTMGTNHLGHFLLTNLLLDNLKTTAEEAGEARVVVVTSMLHDSRARRRNLPGLDLEDLFLAKPGAYSADLAYKNSKLANVLFTLELAHKLEGSKVTVNCVCPGFIPNTDLMRNASSATRFFCRNVLGKLLKFTKVTRTLEQGTKAIVDLATSEAMKEVSGKYYRDGAEAAPSQETKNEELVKNLWELSARYCHMEGYEPLDAPVPPTPEEIKAAEEAAKAAKAAAKKGSKKAATAEKAEEEKKEEGEEKEAADKEATEKEAGAGGEGKTDGADSGEKKAEDAPAAEEKKEEKEEEAGDVKKSETAEETPTIVETAAQ